MACVMMSIIVMMMMIIFIVSVLAWIMTFLVQNVCMISNALEMCPELSVTLALGKRTDLHVDVSTGHLRLLIGTAHGQ